MSFFDAFEKFSLPQEYPSDIKRQIEIQYLVLFRQWKKLFQHNISNDMENPLYYPVSTGGELKWKKHSTLKLKNCIEWNWGYIAKYLRNNAKKKKYEELKNIVVSDNELSYYSDIIEDDKDVYDLFFYSEQPMLDVEYFEAQEKASLNLNVHKYNLIFDEVGTGKTVSALYCMQDVLTEKKERSKILIVCPHNKKIEWQSDIQRQLGRYAHYVENNDDEVVYSNALKEIFFKRNEPCIFIEGQKENEIKETLHSYNTGAVKWDLIIIDEGHLCFDNYKDLKGEKAVLLTATPIVVNSSISNEEANIKVRNLNEYVILLSKITSSNNQSLENLFDNNDIFTQLFREDLDLVSKKRDIRFLVCERLENREYYLDILGEAKGGMTGHIYEQDDDFLLHGVYEKFKSEIDEDLLEDTKPKIDNKKIIKLKEYINSNPTKSYIIFCNCKYPADNIYRNLVASKNDLQNMENTIIAKKYGGDSFAVYPTDNTVTKDNIFDYILRNIQQCKRVIFITTGASGGTGLNLGDFDGVINYELPFTCIELEQRFGRVDRMNNNAESKKMIFILNNDSNPMLRYGVLKINATCTYMPIRNTVLFYPDFIKGVNESLKNEIDSCEISDEEKVIIDKLMYKRNSYSNKISQIVSIEEHLLKKQTIAGFQDDVGDISDYADLLKKHEKTVLSVYKKKKKLLALDDEIMNWKRLLGKEDSKESKSTSWQTVEEDAAEKQEYTQKGTGVEGAGVFVKDESNGDKLGLFDEIDLSTDELANNLPGDISEQTGTSGIFYIKDGKYIHQTVNEFRGKNDE